MRGTMSSDRRGADARTAQHDAATHVLRRARNRPQREGCLQYVLIARRTFALLVLAASAILTTTSVSGQRAIFLVRHAERVDESTDALSSDGERRAERLKDILRDAGVTVVYATELQRTRKTAEPLARALKLDVHHTPRKADEAVRLLRSKHANDVVLIVGHSNTVPEMLKAFGYEQDVEIAAGEYDNLFLVVCGEQKPTVIRLKY